MTTYHPLPILGPIETSFMIVISYNDYDPQYLTLIPGTTGNRYTFFDFRAGMTGTVGVFSVTGEESSLIISDSANQGYLGIDSENYLINSNGQTGFNLTQIANPIFGVEPIYQPWNSPNIFLSDAYYEINVSGQSFVNVETINSSGTGGSRVLQFQPLPSTWYGNTPTQTCQLINPQISLNIWACTSYDDGIFCSSPTGITMGWTNYSDCLLGIEYQYCPTGYYCGTTGNCNGPCSSISNSCDYIAETYVCVAPPKPIPPKPIPPKPIPPKSQTKIWGTPIFIGIVVGIGILALILIIIGVIIKYKTKKIDNIDQKGTPS